MQIKSHTTTNSIQSQVRSVDVIISRDMECAILENIREQ